MSKTYELLNKLIGEVNKAVKTKNQTLTEEQKTQARANISAANQTAVNQLSEQIADLGGNPIPDYWKDELETKADAIRVAMETAGRNKSAFLWYTDAHWQNSAKVSPVLLSHLVKNTLMNKVNFGGDVVCDPSPYNHENVEYVYEWRKMVSGLPNHHSVYGNHDVNHRTTDVGNIAYSLLIAPEESPDMVVGGDSYYYIDNPSEKTRYLYLSYTTTGIGLIEQEGKFIAETIKTVDEGWHIVVINHRWFGYSSASTPTVGSVPAFEAEVLEVFDAYNARTTRNATTYFEAQDFTNAKGKVEFCIGGHIHVDYDFYSNGGIPVINTAPDANQNRVPDSGVDSGTVGTITESAIFGIIADYTEDNAKITVVGIGRGTSRVIRQASIAPTGISNITYSGDTTVGTTIDKSKFGFTVNYSNGTSTTVTGATSVSPATIGVVGNNTVTITYTEGATSVSGIVTIVGEAKEVVNLFNKDDANIHDTGRFNSSMAVVNGSAGQLVTGYIEAKVGDVFTVKTDKAQNSTSYTGDAMPYDSGKNPLGKIARETPAIVSISSDYLECVYTIPESYRINTSTTYDYSGTVWIRFCVAYTNKDKIVITKV